MSADNTQIEATAERVEQNRPAIICDGTTFDSVDAWLEQKRQDSANTPWWKVARWKVERIVTNAWYFFRYQIAQYFARGRYGIAKGDEYALNTYLAGVMARGMRHLANRHFGYPNNGTDDSEFNSQEEWDAWLNDRAAWLEGYANEEFDMFDNREKYEEFHEVVLPDIVKHWEMLWY